MSGAEVPIVVCVSADVAVRERVLRQLDGVGSVVSCADLAQLRAMLFPSPGGATPAVGPVAPPVAPQGPVSWGKLVVDRAGGRVTWRDEPLPLTPTERELLVRLVGPPLVLWSYEQLCASVLGGADTALLHSTMKRLRHRLRALPGGPQVHTVRGVGYRLGPLPPPA
ncbi:winged helix-turn-helix domain-containing protein [Micromonospora sp. LH3U1]|uniref:winged helix-turn-helix domain-containing protein n=1 Tax=Micromonospora sp. LH3U1 TaxID=3018339 RepID=UPI00234BEAB6|nr:winged helix-turn-helix domain-containing protein [Micromonospora sp. LH3U1]WCN84798.1 winged helix-turn-helix domain-containing protein [Micromonospora sp. LH3U1]